jgi:hypothetical protein
MQQDEGAVEHLWSMSWRRNSGLGEREWYGRIRDRDIKPEMSSIGGGYLFLGAAESDQELLC